MAKRIFKVGDQVSAFLFLSNKKKLRAKGKIKSVTTAYGRDTYILTDVTAEDFATRTIKKVKN